MERHDLLGNLAHRARRSLLMLLLTGLGVFALAGVSAMPAGAQESAPQPPPPPPPGETNDSTTKEDLVRQRADRLSSSSSRGFSTQSVDGPLYNDFLSVQVDSGGRFNMGARPDPATGGSQAGSFNLMYRWPSSPGTSFTTVRVDGADHVYGSGDGTIVEAPRNVDATTNVSVWETPEGIRVKQTLRLVEGQGTANPDTAQVSYELTNTSGAEHTIGLRVMNDTMLNGNDGALFRIPGTGNVTTETDFAGDSVPDYFLGLQSFDDSEHVSAATLRGGAATPPDRLIVGVWGGLYDTDFDYTTSPSTSIAGDSAYAVYWTNRTLAAGESATFTHYYGTSGVAADLRPPLAVNLSAPTSLDVNEGGALTPNPFTVGAFLQNTGNGPAENVTASISSIPDGLVVESPETVTLGGLAVGEETEASWQVRAPESTEEKTYTLAVEVAADGVEPKVVEKQIVVPASGSTDTGREPVIFVPGVGGSKLLYAQSGSYYEEGDEKWIRYLDVALNATDPFLRDLKLAPNGEDPFDNPNSADDSAYLTKVGDIVRYEAALQTPLGDVGALDVYRTTMDKLSQDYGYVEGEDLFLFPFDWRKDLRTTTGGSPSGLDNCEGIAEGVTLNEFIDCVRDETGSEKTNIMAHSQGGLVTEAALSKQESVGKVDKVLSLGTPFLGAAQSFGILQYQAPCFAGELPILDVCAVNPKIAQEIFTNFPGAYQLLPSRLFHAVEGSPLYIDRNVLQADENGEKPYDFWTGLIKQDRNAALMELADNFHQALDGSRPADPAVEWHRVIGDKVSTPDHVREYSDCPTIGGLGLVCSLAGNTAYEIVMSDEDEGGAEGGDGTVPLHSADLYNPNPDGNPSTNDAVDLRNGIPNSYCHGVKHSELPKNEQVLAFANAYFGNELQPASERVCGSSSSQESSTFSAQSVETNSSGANSTGQNDASTLANQFGLDDSPESFGGIELESVGPVEGYIRDQNGKLLGDPPDAPEGFITEELPGGQYNALQETQSFFLNKAGSYTAKLSLTGQDGSQAGGQSAARLRVRTYAEGEMIGQAVFQVAAPQGSDLQLAFTSGGSLSDLRLLIDEDGDGTAERQQAPDSVVTGPAASDKTSPQATASYEELSLDEGQVTINAADNQGGSGIANTYYAIGENGQSRLYKGPFTVPLGTTVRFTTTDRAGNTAGIKELKVGNKPLACTITGTQENDVIQGTAGDDVICALGGNDRIDPGAGNDTVRGGAGEDTINAGGGNDRLSGDAGNDRLDGQDGDDTLYGGADDDILNAGLGDDKLSGGDDRDRLDGGSGKDTMKGGNGVDVMYAGPGTDTLSGGAGQDQLAGEEDSDRLNGGSGIDIIEGGSGNDTLDGRDGVGGNDTVDGGPETDDCQADTGDTVKNCES